MRVAELAGGAGARYEKPKRLDIYLAYLVKLGEPAGLTVTGSRSMRFYKTLEITEAEIDAAWPELRDRLRTNEFESYLSRNFVSWEPYMKRNFRVAYEAAQKTLRDTMEDELDRRLRAEIDKMAFREKNEPDIAKQLEDMLIDTRGPLIRNEIWDETMLKVTREFLRANGQERLLEPEAWPLGEPQPFQRENAEAGLGGG